MVAGLAGTLLLSSPVGALATSGVRTAPALTQNAPASPIRPVLAASVTAPHGIVPPANPAQTIAPSPNFLANCSASYYDDSQGCLDATLQAITNARAQEGVADMALPTDWASLSPQEQLFVATNLERTARGLTPLSAMATTLDQAAQQGAGADQDPSPPGGFPWSSWGSNWTAAVGNPLEAIYYWMYDDGEGSSNADCTPANTSGCWQHRDNILMALRCQPCEIGTGYASGAWQGQPSWTALLVDTSGATSLDYTWTQVLPYLSNSNGTGSSNSDLFEFVSDHAFGCVWNSYDQTAATGGPDIAATPSALVDPHDGFLHVFVSAGDSHLFEYVNDDTGGRVWNYYDLTAAFGVLDISGSPSALVDPHDGFLHVFERASDGHLLEYVNDGVGGRAWNPYDLTATYAPSTPLGAAPDAIYDSAQGLIHVYAQSAATGHLVEYTNDGANGQPWNAYDLTVNAGSGSPVSGIPSAVYDTGQDLIHTYVEGANGHLVEYLSDHADGHVWNAYDLSANAGSGTPIGGSPGSVYDAGQDLIHTYVEGANGELFEYVSDHADGHVWNSYDLSANAGGGAGVSGIPDPVYDSASDLIHTYVEGANSHLVEYLSDHVDGHVWNSYDLSENAGGGVDVDDGTSAIVIGDVIHVYVGGG
ncbi:MAG: hypothetical protein ABSC00_07170 [Acidimicrobiales bacterium]